MGSCTPQECLRRVPTHQEKPYEVAELAQWKAMCCWKTCEEVQNSDSEALDVWEEKHIGMGRRHTLPSANMVAPCGTSPSKSNHMGIQFCSKCLFAKLPSFCTTSLVNANMVAP